MEPATMKAILCPRYGPPEVLELQDMPLPTPTDAEVLIKVRAATVTAGDCELRRFQITPLFWLPVRLIFGIFRPKKKMRIIVIYLFQFTNGLILIFCTVHRSTFSSTRECRCWQEYITRSVNTRGIRQRSWSCKT